MQAIICEFQIAPGSADLTFLGNPCNFECREQNKRFLSGACAALGRFYEACSKLCDFTGGTTVERFRPSA